MEDRTQQQCLRVRQRQPADEVRPHRASDTAVGQGLHILVAAFKSEGKMQVSSDKRRLDLLLMNSAEGMTIVRKKECNADTPVTKMYVWQNRNNSRLRI